MNYQTWKEKILKEPDKPFFLTKNFTFQELVKTQHRALIQKNMMMALEEKIFNNLYLLANKLLQPLRNLIGCPININSGYRCPELNQIVGGSAKSQHLFGEACDFVLVKSITMSEQFNLVYKTLKDNKIDYGQIIYEHTWIHLSLPNQERNIINQKPLVYKDGKYEIMEV